jgi:SAM-dependent methyltransferase
VPADRLFDRVFFSQHAPLRIAQCDRCGTLYRDPRESAREVMETYAGEEPNERVLEALLNAQKPVYHAQARRFTRIVGRVGNGLEVGSYVGGFLAAARELGWTMTGVDLNATANAFARARGLAIQTGTLDDAPCGPFDAIVIWNCFDQLPDPRGTLRAARQRLRAGGVLALRVANGACYGRLRLHAFARPFLAWNNLLAFPYRQGFTPSSICFIAAPGGIQVAGDPWRYTAVNGGPVDEEMGTTGRESGEDILPRGSASDGTVVRSVRGLLERRRRRRKRRKCDSRDVRCGYAPGLPALARQIQQYCGSIRRGRPFFPCPARKTWRHRFSHLESHVCGATSQGNWRCGG